MNWVGQTNQRLYQCRLLLEQLPAAAEANQGQALTQGLNDAALLQLLAAYRCYLNELAQAAGVNSRVESLPQLLQQTSLVTGDMRQWQALSEDVFSWFYRFLQAVEQLGWPALSGVEPMLATRLITSTADDPVSGDGEDVSGWLACFHQLIDEQRANQRES
ncbi:DUF6586 family protein [Oceanobacter sp. 5_MG-2023]|jgi:hypothetical protein|uniref:DUF6586 family protein n=1 Tax=unclassified Oceanobacter TaxID=2620260 RepID=UPI0034C6660F